MKMKIKGHSFSIIKDCKMDDILWKMHEDKWNKTYFTEANIRIKSITYNCYATVSTKHFKGPLKIQVSPLSNGGIKSKSRFCRDGALIN